MAAATKLVVHLLIQNDFNYLLELASDQQERDKNGWRGFLLWEQLHLLTHAAWQREVIE